MLEPDQLDVGRIQRLCHAGIPDYPGMRALYWKVRACHHVSSTLLVLAPYEAWQRPASDGSAEGVHRIGMPSLPPLSFLPLSFMCNTTPVVSR